MRGDLGVCDFKMKNKILPYNSKLKLLARKLRNNSTYGEIKLWKGLRNKQMLGYDFHRQKPIDNYIIDFYCPALKLAIEVDGPSHNEKISEDNIRQKNLERFGIRFLRFSEKGILNNCEGVLGVIENYILNLEQEHTPPTPLKRGEILKL